MSKQIDPVVIYESEKGEVELHTDVKGDTIWATRAQIAELFVTAKQNVDVHIENIYQDGELSESATTKDSLVVQKEGKRTIKRNIVLYNLDAIIAVGR